MSTPKPDIARAVKATQVEEVPLFDTAPSWADHWWGMPSFVMEDCAPYLTIAVHFASWDDVETFAATIGQPIGRRTKGVWFPPQSVEKSGEWSYA